MRCDGRKTVFKMDKKHFNPRTSCEVRLACAKTFRYPAGISIHAPRVRCDEFGHFSESFVFQISIHAPRVRCDASISSCLNAVLPISIHAPRVRCDKNENKGHKKRNYISIHAPRVRCDGFIPFFYCNIFLFQSTHLV